LRRPLNVFAERLEEILEYNFSQFRTFKEPDLEKALQQSVRFCVDMASADKPARWLTLLGPCGVGKTLLAKFINRFYGKFIQDLPDDRNVPGEIWNRRGGFKPWINVINDMMNGDYSGIRDLKQDWFLVIDDIGVEYGKNRELATTKLFEILNARENLFTVITGNLTLEDIDSKLDARIASRLLRNGSSVVNIVTKDFNLR